MEQVLDIEAIAAADDRIAYGSSSTFNGLFEIQLDTGEARYIARFPFEEDKRRLHVKAVCDKSKVFFIPYSGQFISIYDMQEKRFESIRIRKVDLERYGFFKDNAKFTDGIIYENFLYLICSTYPAICKMDLESYAVEYIDQWVPSEGYCFRKGMYLDGDTFYIPSISSNLVLKFVLGEDRETLYHIGDERRGFWSCCMVGDDLWLAPKGDGPVVKWNEKTQTAEKLSDYPRGFRNCDFLFSKIYQRGNRIFLIPAYSNMLLEISLEDGKMYNSHLLNPETIAETYYMFQIGSQIGLKVVEKDHRETRTSYMKLDCNTNQMIPYQFVFSNGKEAFEKEYWNLQLSNPGICMKEQRPMGLEDYIRFLISR